MNDKCIQCNKKDKIRNESNFCSLSCALIYYDNEKKIKERKIKIDKIIRNENII